MQYLRVVRNRSVFTPEHFDLQRAIVSLMDLRGGRTSVFAIASDSDHAIAAARLIEGKPRWHDRIRALG